ncbi:hypothetical protein Xish_02155 [Xenorhabdus ishibashii]|uniref:Uncharacterized protein n=2 Tax=Xenorhabdus ishibashii TaxID=1034471 RepID=A0A2D0KHM4_9GAMM|nr:hypothetical protein Xish_02155 [Xenorhabdus ishibashii]
MVGAERSLVYVLGGISPCFYFGYWGGVNGVQVCDKFNPHVALNINVP